MLTITIAATELFDSQKSEFITVPSQKLQLEHSLVSISKWEAKWHVPFLDSKRKKTRDETIDYIRCMTIKPPNDPNVYLNISSENIKLIHDYIDDPMSATTINHSGSKASSEITTSEVLYYYMIALNIPLECERWHLNRLTTLIDVCSIKNTPPKKMSKKDTLSRNRSLNAARKQAANTQG